MESVRRVTPGELRTVIAGLLGLPPSAAEYPYRLLREKGLVSRGGRGRSSVAVQPRDAALLLIALAGQLPAQDLLASTLEYTQAQVNGEVEHADQGHLVVWDNERLHWDLASEWAPSLAALSLKHTFLDCITALIVDAAAGDLRASTGPAIKYGSKLAKIDVTLSGPSALARVRMATGERSQHKVYRLAGPDELGLHTHLSFPGGRVGDLHQERWFSQDTLLGLGAMFSGTPWPIPEEPWPDEATR